MSAGQLLQTTRLSCGLKQGQLARQAGTTQTYISRVERGVVSPSLSTLERLLHAMGQQLTLSTEPGDCGNVSREDLRRDYQTLTAAERIDQAFELSEFLTDVAAQAKEASYGTR